jgi:AcrR family transcriptional regulator
MLYREPVARSSDRPGGEVGLRAAGVQRTRQSVVAAVRERLIEAGYHGLSLEQVAEDAGITRVTIYRQFGSKLGLLQAVADDLTERGHAAERLGAAVALRDASAALRSLVAELCRFWDTDPRLFRRMVSLAAVDPEARQVIETRERWRYDGLSTVIGRLAHEGRLRAPYGQDQAIATIVAITSFPACDQIASALGVSFAELPGLLLPLLSAVLDLQPPSPGAGHDGGG